MFIKPSELSLEKIYTGYFFMGDEPLQMLELPDGLSKNLQEKGYIHEKIIVESASDIDIFKNNLQSGSLFSDLRLLEIRWSGVIPDKAIQEGLLHYFENPVPEWVLIFKSPKLDKSQQKQKWFQALSKKIAIIQIWPVFASEFPSWVLKRAQQNYQLTLDSAAKDFLVQATENNMVAAAQFLEKLSLLYPANTLIDLEKIELLVTNNAQYNIYDFIDALLLGNIKRSIAILTKLQQGYQEPALIIWALAQEIRRLIKLSHALQNKQDIWQELGILKSKQSFYSKALQRFKNKSLTPFLLQCLTLDKINKGVMVEDIWRQLLHFCVKFTKN